MYNKNHYPKSAKLTGFIQRLAVSQIVVALVHLFLPFIKAKKRNQAQLNQSRKNFGIKIAIFLIFPTINILLTQFLKVPNCDRGYTGPGYPKENDSPIDLQKCPGGANRYIDEFVWGIERIPKQPKCSFFYGCDRFDEDGHLGTLNFIFGVALGSIAGEYFLRKRHKVGKLSKLFFAQIFVSMMTGSILGGIPGIQTIKINSQLWSFSFVCVANAFSLIFLIAIAGLILKNMWVGWPFRAVGKNAIFILIFQQLMADRFPFGYKHNGNYLDAILSCLLTCSVWVGIAILLHGYKFYIKY